MSLSCERRPFFLNLGLAILRVLKFSDIILYITMNYETQKFRSSGRKICLFLNVFAQ